MIMTSLTQKKRLRKALIITAIIFITLLIRVSFIQLVQGSDLEEMAYNQQTSNRDINPKRGTIYDATGKNVLAISASVETVTVNPVNIKENDRSKIATIFSELFDLDYETALKRVSKRSSIEIIARRVEKEKTDKLRVWMKENNISSGINIDEDTKRYYPYNNLASHIIGFCGSDNQGLDGVEAKYDDTLKGKVGQIKKITDARGGEINDENENYIPAVEGKDLVLTIDMTIQSIAEKYLKQACIDNVCTGGGNIVIMNPKNGDILAMTTYPDYDLNSPYEINTDELKGNWDSMSSQDKTKALQQMWRNRAIADGYEPGSTFKLITTSAALEEGLTSTDNKGEFCCTGSIEVAGVRIKCWRHYRPHGSQSLRDALMNSCNPIFIGLGQRIGVSKYYEYLKKFGLLGTTGIDLYGEAGSIFLKENKVGPVELATISFGQRFKITPVQMVTAVSTIANGGTLVQPRIVKQIIDNETGVVEEVQPILKERVISEKTSKDVLSMMESVVAEGTGKNAKVQGYSIGGKTGTSEDGVNTNKYVTSFIGVSTIEDPEVVILITLYNPTGQGGHQGGAVAAPIASQVLGEVLPYLEVTKSEMDENQEMSIQVPDIRNMSIKEAKLKLKEANLLLQTNIPENEEIDDGRIIIEQTPKPGILIRQKSKIYVEI